MFSRYAKSISAAVGALATWGLAASADGVYEQQEWWGLVAAAGTTLVVFAVPNTPEEDR